MRKVALKKEWQKLNLAGNRIGDLLIIKELEPEIRFNKENPYWVRFWECQCICGKIIVRDQRTLRKNSNNNSNCGCLHKQITKNYWKDKKRLSGESHSRWTGCRDISGRYWRNLKSSAKNRNIDFDLKIEDAWNLFLFQDKKCKLTGLPINFKERTASLDRINSNSNYSINNVQWVHKDVNKMKMDLDLSRFFEICEFVATLNRKESI